MNKSKSIGNLFELSEVLKIKPQKLAYLLYVVDINSMYKVFTIPKRNGGTRTICAPEPELKQIQKRIDKFLRKIQNDYYHSKGINPNISHAFNKNKSIKTNSLVHTNKRYVLNIDLENFFDSFHFGRVQGFFYKNNDLPFSSNVATMLANLVCCNGKLPQGAPSSPIITEMISNILDIRILQLAKKYKLDYTRYADDLTFSTNRKNFIDDYNVFMQKLNKCIEKNGFVINKNKSKLMFKDSHQEVTGVTVNKFSNINNNYYKKTRSMANELYRNGIFTIDDVPSNINQLDGRFSFVDYISFNNGYKYINHKINEFNIKEKDIQQFLFYKYFVINDKPLIITEGKTDIKYIKAALKSLSSSFPNLITNNGYGVYHYNVDFLKRSNKLDRYFGLKLDGADTINRIFDLYVGNRKQNNYYEIFSNKFQITPKNPVILIFDNETISDRPLRKFINYINKNNSISIDINKLSKNINYARIIYNLYVVTNPLMPGCDENEIEDLFDKSTLEKEIDGKHFSKEVKDEKKQFGKERFSNYVINNYSSISFVNFTGFISSINNVINEYTKK